MRSETRTMLDTGHPSDKSPCSSGCWVVGFLLTSNPFEVSSRENCPSSLRFFPVEYADRLSICCVVVWLVPTSSFRRTNPPSTSGNFGLFPRCSDQRDLRNLGVRKDPQQAWCEDMAARNGGEW